MCKKKYFSHVLVLEVLSPSKVLFEDSGCSDLINPVVSLLKVSSQENLIQVSHHVILE